MSETNTPRKYFSQGGIEVGLLWLIRNSPQWAENQIRHRDRLETELAAAKSEIIKINEWREKLQSRINEKEFQHGEQLAAANERAEAYKEIAEWFAHHFSEEFVIKGRTMKAKLEALNQSIKKTGAEI